MGKYFIIVFSVVMICGIAACSGGALSEELDHMSADLNETVSAIATQEVELTELRQDLDEAESRLSEMENSDVELAEILSETEDEIAQLIDDGERISGEIKVNSELLKSMDSEIEDFSQDLVDLRSQVASSGIEAIELPVSLDEAEREALVSTFKTFWNNEDWQGLYDTLSDFGKLSTSAKEVADIFPEFRSFCGEIGDMAYSHYGYLGEENGADFYSLNYLTEYETGTGDLEITIRSVNGDWETVGFFYNCGVN